MAVNVGAYGRGLAAILGVGAIILAAMEKSSWVVFLCAAVGVWAAGFFLGIHAYNRKKGNSRRRGRRRRR